MSKTAIPESAEPKAIAGREISDWILTALPAGQTREFADVVLDVSRAHPQFNRNDISASLDALVTRGEIELTLDPPFGVVLEMVRRRVSPGETA